MNFEQEISRLQDALVVMGDPEKCLTEPH